MSYEESTLERSSFKEAISDRERMGEDFILNDAFNFATLLEHEGIDEKGLLRVTYIRLLGAISQVLCREKTCDDLKIVLERAGMRVGFLKRMSNVSESPLNEVFDLLAEMKREGFEEDYVMEEFVFPSFEIGLGCLECGEGMFLLELFLSQGLKNKWLKDMSV